MSSVSPSDLFRGKFYVPAARTDLVVRTRLLARLDDGLTRPLTLICAPAGYGKTTLLSHWLSRQQHPIAWLSLDKQDNDPIHFWTYVIAALQTIQPGLGQPTLAALQSPQPPPTVALMPGLLEQISSPRTLLALVLDDYQFITDRTIHEALAYFLNGLADQIHLVISTRVDPPLPLGRFRVRNQLVELRASDLRFTTDEAMEFLNQMTDSPLASEEVAALEARTEGWIAGLQLAALSMQGHQDVAPFVKAFTGSHVYVAEYLVEEVLQQMPEDIQLFLLQTAVLNRLNGRLCEAVTGRNDAQSVLIALQHANLFIVPLDDKADWFRYHHLFADLLRARLHQAFSEGELRALHQRAASWYEQHGFVTEAIDHALQGKDYERVASLVEKQARPLMFSGSVNTLMFWLAALPEDTLHAHPRLQLYQTWIDIMQGKADLSEPAIQATDDMLKALPQSPENEQLRVEWMVISCRFIALTGNTTRAIQFARAALEKLPATDLASRARVCSALTIAYGLEGDIENGQLAYRECMSLALTAGYYSLAAHTTMMMAAGLDQHYGQLREAERLYQSIIDMGAQQSVFFPAGQGLIGLAEVQLERGNFDAVEGYLQQGISLCSQAGLAGVSTGYAIESRLRQARGDLEGALEILHSVEEVAPRSDFTGMIRQIQVRLAIGDADGAARWATPLMQILSVDPNIFRVPLLIIEFFKSILVRVLLAQGEVDKALVLLDELQATAEPGKRHGRMIDIYLLRALTLQRQNGGDVNSAALDNFIQALELAEPEGYQLVFLEEGKAVIPLLSAVAANAEMPDHLQQYARKLLSGLSADDKGIDSPSVTDLPEQLTPRELEVLKLIAAGDSNRTVATKLVITVSAVKKHTGNIFGKLNVNSRTQAIVRARQVGLLAIDS